MFGGYGNENMDTVAKYEAIEQRLHQYPHILPKKHFVSEGVVLCEKLVKLIAIIILT
jgi:hypothetical protein